MKIKELIDELNKLNVNDELDIKWVDDLVESRTDPNGWKCSREDCKKPKRLHDTLNPAVRGGFHNKVSIYTIDKWIERCNYCIEEIKNSDGKSNYRIVLDELIFDSLIEQRNGSNSILLVNGRFTIIDESLPEYMIDDIKKILAFNSVNSSRRGRTERITVFNRNEYEITKDIPALDIVF